MTLLQALYDPSRKLPSDPGFFEATLKDIEYFGISPQVWHLLKHRGIHTETPGFFQSQLQKRADECLNLNLLIHNQTEQILRGFEALGIEAIPLKGTRFAQKYFGHIGARPTSDIDILLHKQDLKRAKDYIQSLGFTIPQKQHYMEHHSCFGKKFAQLPIPLVVELHWHFMKEHTVDLDIDEFWDQSSPIGTYKNIKELSDYHTFYMICLHGWKHNFDSPRYFMDIVQLVEVLQDRLDYDLLLKNAKMHKAQKRIIRTLSLVYRCFPHLTKKVPFPKQISVPLWNFNNYRYQRNFAMFFDLVRNKLSSYDSMKHCWNAINAWFRVTINR